MLHIDLDFDRVTDLLIYQYLKFGPSYLSFGCAKNIHVLQVLICGFGGHLRFLTEHEVLHLDHDLDTVTVF